MPVVVLAVPDTMVVADIPVAVAGHMSVVALAAVDIMAVVVVVAVAAAAAGTPAAPG